MDLALVAQAVVNGLMLASVYALVALGLTMIFGLLDVINFAHGQLLLLGAYLTYAVTATGAPYPVALLLSVGGVALMGAVLDVGLFARVRSTPINGLLLSIGLVAIFANVFQAIWGTTQREVAAPVDHVFRFGEVYLPTDRLVIVVGTLATLATLAWFLRRTRAGTALRATAQNPEAAAIMGIHPERVRHVAFAIGAALAGLSGSFLATVFPVEPALGEAPLLKGFIVLIIGGAGSPVGAVLGALTLGMAESVGLTWWSTGVADMAAFALLIVILFLRPQGFVRVARENPL